ncbi:MAG: PAS domain S-box protein, partial [Gammaproteobacteria bacterium]|nr:PAS domain S-box protein [Gammaproteobacteria bacterium]
MTLRGKLLSGFGMMLLLLLIQGVFSGLMFRQSQQLEQSVSTVELPLVLEVLELRELLYQTEGALNGWILSGEESFREQYRTLWTRVMEKNSQIEVSTLDLEILLLKRKQDEAFVLAHTLEGEPAKELFQNKLLPNAKEVQSAARRLLFYERRRAQGDASFQSLKQSKMLVYTLSNFQRSFSELLALLNTVLLSGDRDGERRFIKHWRENQGAWVALNRAELTTQQQAEMGRIRAVRQHFHQDALKMIELRMDPKWNLAAWKVSQEVSLLLLQVVEQVDELVSQRTEQMNQGFERHAEMMDEGGKVVWLFLVVALLTVLLTARALILRIYRPIQRVQQVFQEILSKDYHSPIKVESNDEMGVLLMSLKEMREQLRDAEIDEQASRSALLNQKFALDQAANVSATDLDGVIVYVNQRMLDLTGYSEEEVIGERHDLFKSGIHDESFYREMWDTMSAGLVWHGEICDRTKDGDLVWLDTTIVPFLGENMQPIEYMAIRNDVTLIKESEQRIREEQERTIAANHDLQHSMQRL